MTDPINNRSGVADGKSAAAAGSKPNGHKPNQTPVAETATAASSDQVSLSTAGLKLTGQVSANAIGTADEAFALAARTKSLLNDYGAAALAAHGGKTSVDLKGLLQPA